jgi:hypothetical protein
LARKFSGKIYTRFQHQFILNSLQIILKNNVFYFDGQYYTQNKGTAMGPKVVPTYKTLVLEYLEKTLYGKKQQFTETNFQTTLK